MTNPALATNQPPTDAILARLSGLHPKVIDLSLGRIERLLARLDDPQHGLPPVVHVAGTNGKGSVIAYLRAMFEAAGFKTHVYTSPHLVRFHERIRLAGHLIDESYLAALLSECEAANGGEPITFFEITTAAAFLAFSRTPADVVLLETGLGGRLDATNMVPRPALSAITSISIDHTQFLGDTLRRIAREKAGILKPGVRAVIGPQPRAAREAILEQARQVGAPLYLHGEDWTYRSSAGGFLYTGVDGKQRYAKPGLIGEHQVENAAFALACAEALPDFPLGDEAKRRGLVEARWPGRLQQLSQGPLVDLLPPTQGGTPAWEIWLDGGHNSEAGRVLAKVVRNWSDSPVHLIFGMMNSKSPTAFLNPLAPLVCSVRSVTIPDESGALSADDAARRAEALGLPVKAMPSVAAGVEEILHQHDKPGRILICGSLYLAGTVLRDNA